MVDEYSVQSHGASLVFLRTAGEVISEEYTSGCGEAMWESGGVRLRHCFTLDEVISEAYGFWR